MNEPDFDRFDDSTLTMDVTVAEYRALVSFRAVGDYLLAERDNRIAELEAEKAGLIEQVILLQEEVANEKDEE